MKILLICRQESEGAHALASCAEEHGFCVRLCFSCAEAERLLSRFMPDLAVFDAVLPDGDGLELLERWAGRTAARFICLTPFVNDFVLLSCKAYGAEYVLPQSMNAEMVMRRIMQIDAGAVDYIQPSADGEETRLNEAAARLLGSIGMQHGRLGFRYARCALLEMALCSSRPICDIYAEIARKYGTKGYCVERSIRSAVEDVWTKGNLQAINEMFGYSVKEEKGKPTNREFLFVLFEKLSFEYPELVRHIIH